MSTDRPPGQAGQDSTESLVWYAAYGSNLLEARFRFYARGGTPTGTTRAYPGFRDRRPVVRSAALTLPGCVYFSWESRVWGGGMAFYAPGGRAGWPQGVAARGYLLTTGQFADLVAQEMHRPVGTDLDLSRVLRDGRDTLGDGRYETLVRAGDLDGHPILTCTAPWDPATVELRSPAPRYVGLIATGLHETHGWASDRIAGYLAGLPGIEGIWDRHDLNVAVDRAVSHGVVLRRGSTLVSDPAEAPCGTGASAGRAGSGDQAATGGEGQVGGGEEAGAGLDDGGDGADQAGRGSDHPR